MRHVERLNADVHAAVNEPSWVTRHVTGTPHHMLPHYLLLSFQRSLTSSLSKPQNALHIEKKPHAF